MTSHYQKHKLNFNHTIPVPVITMPMMMTMTITIWTQTFKNSTYSVTMSSDWNIPSQLCLSVNPAHSCT